MHVAKDSAPAGIWHRASDAHRSLPRLAARLLYTKDEEELGLEEVDRVSVAIERSVRSRFLVFAALFGLCAFLSSLVLLVWGVASVTDRNIGQAPVIAFMVLMGIAALTLVYWRHFQYGLGIIGTKRPALYGESRPSTVETLEKLFDFLGRRTAPEAYYYDRKGIRHPVSRRHFYGRLRGLLLSESAGDRALVLPPNGFWFSRQIYVDAEPEEVIRALKVKPQAGGRPKAYDYEAMLLTMIEHPSLRNIDPDKHGAETQVMNLIRARCDPSEAHDNDIPVPEPTKLREFAKKIVAAIQINRSAR